MGGVSDHKETFIHAKELKLYPAYRKRTIHKEREKWDFRKSTPVVMERMDQKNREVKLLTEDKGRGDSCRGRKDFKFNLWLAWLEVPQGHSVEMACKFLIGHRGPKLEKEVLLRSMPLLWFSVSGMDELFFNPALPSASSVCGDSQKSWCPQPRLYH
jgi:hypothetical protein